MSRAAVLQALREDADLNALVPPENVLTNWSKEGRPNILSPGGFMVLRWEATSRAFKKIAGPRDLTIWAHWPVEKSTDFTHIDAILNRTKDVLCDIEDTVGGDGYTVTCVDYAGESGDVNDPGFQTITRNMTFRVLSRPT